MVLDQESGLYRAEGDVQIEQGDLRLTAGTADWSQESGKAFCSGGFRLESSDGVMTGDSLNYDFTTGLGFIENGEAELAASSVFLSGDKIEKRGDISYRVTGGSFTTCSGEKPAWKLTASTLDVDVDGYAEATNAILYLRDIPILYFPYITLPAKTTRQTGLLFLEYSHSTRLGEQFKQPFYLVIDDHMDATLTADYMSDFGFGTGLEYRYLLNDSQPGRFFGNYITGFDDEPDRALVEWTHDGQLPGGTRLVADVEYASKKDYFSIFGGNADVYASEKSQSTIYLSRPWEKSVLAGRAQYTRDLDQSSSTILQYLPEVRFDYMPHRVADSALFVSFLAETSYLWQREGFKGTRLRLQPTLSSDLLVNRYIEIVPQIAWLQRDYRFDDSSEEEGIPVATVTAGSRLSRVFNVNGKSLTHIRHAVEPIFRYTYIPEVDQSHLPQLDYLDRIDPQNTLTFELMNRLTARLLKDGNLPQYREFASLRLAVDYDIAEERRTPGPLPDKNRPFSPIRGELILRPSQTSYLRGDLAYDANDNADYVESWSAWAGLHDHRGNGLLVNYNYLRNDFDYLSGGVDVALLDPLYFSYQHRYDVETDFKLEEVVQLELRGKCWAILVSYSDRPAEEKVDFEFSLSGISAGEMITSFSKTMKNFF
jgi:LPS-assembly protein